MSTTPCIRFDPRVSGDGVLDFVCVLADKFARLMEADSFAAVIPSLYASTDFQAKQTKKLLPELEKAAESAQAALEGFLRQGTAEAVP